MRPLRNRGVGHSGARSHRPRPTLRIVGVGVGLAQGYEGIYPVDTPKAARRSPAGRANTDLALN